MAANRKKESSLLAGLDNLIEKEVEESSVPVMETPVTEKHEEIPTIINVIDKSHVGRPKVLQGVYKPISARLKIENYEYARVTGGKFGGMNAFINWLIEEYRRNNSEK